jgi:hypothetical protein
MFAFLASVGIPILTDFFKSAAPAVSRKLFGESVDDTIKLGQLDINRLDALSKLDNPYGTPSQWVVNLRGSFRYVASAGLILGGLGLAGYGASTYNPVLVASGIELALSPSGFILGERMVLSLKGGNK